MPKRHSLRTIAISLVATGVLSLGCAQRPRTPDLALTYNRAAGHHGPERNPIIAIPGILGTKLVTRQSLRVVWGAFDRGFADPANPEDARLIALPIHSEPVSGPRADEVEPAGVLDRVRVSLLGIPVDILTYAQILATLGAGGYRDESLGLAGAVDYGRDHFTCFQFGYDWRRDNVESARRFARFVREKQAGVRAEYRKRYGIDTPDLKFDVAAHSMGGLMVRYFLMYGEQDLPEDGSLPELTWEGARYLERVILIGTPNAGAPQALLDLINGRDIGPTLPYYRPALMGTFPSTYQLLPRSRHHAVVWDGDRDRPVEDLLDPKLWERLGWGLAAQKEAAELAVLLPRTEDAQARRKAALDLQRRALLRARQFQAALDRPATPPPGLELFLVAGDGQPTPKTISVDSHTGALRVLEQGDGDGTVTRASALMDERQGATWRPFVQTPIPFRHVMFLPAEHLGVTQDPTFRDNVLYWLLEEPRAADPRATPR
jgi:lecithin:cholesterol acyltransferase